MPTKVHDIKTTAGHGYHDQKYVKGNRSPVNTPGGDGASFAKYVADGLAGATHDMDKAIITNRANNHTAWSLASGGDDAYSDRYMSNIGKLGIATQQAHMRDVADSEAESYKK